MSATLPALPHARAVSAVSIMSTASIMSAWDASRSDPRRSALLLPSQSPASPVGTSRMAVEAENVAWYTATSVNESPTLAR